MLNKINYETYLAALHFVQNCKQTYPEINLMEEDIQEQFYHCISIIDQYHIELNKEQMIESKKIESSKNKIKGKLESFKEQALFCLISNEIGEFNQLQEEVGRMKNEYAKRNYERMLNKAKNEFKEYILNLREGR